MPGIADAEQTYANSGAQEVNAGAIGTIAPYAMHMSGPVAPLAQYQPAASPSSGRGLSKVGHFIGGLGTDVGHLAVGAGKWLETNAVNMATSIPRTIQGISRGINDNSQINWNQQRTDQNSKQLQSLVDGYKTGRITKAQYQAGLKELGDSFNKITEDQRSLDTKISLDKQDTYKALIDTASAVVTLLTAGVGSEVSLIPEAIAGKLPGVLGNTVTDTFGAKTAADYLASTNANAMMANVEKGLQQFATDPAAFGKLTESGQYALQKATAEVIAQGGAGRTSAQIARSAAVNLALKNPFYYNFLSTTGHQIYQELDQAKYGEAVRTLGFNGLLMLSGGPIGQALKYGGDAVKALEARSFNTGTFMETLSKNIGTGEADGLYNAFHAADYQDYKFFDKGQLVTLSKEDAQARITQNIRAMAATNLQAVKGKSETDAAWRVIRGMQAYEGINMDNFTHEEFLKNLSNFAEAQRAADFYGPAGTTVGRVDSRDIKNIVDSLSGTISKDNTASMKALNDLIKQNPTRAWANNDNFVRQLKGLIVKYNNGDKFSKAVKEIDTQYRIKGFPRGMGKKLSQMGYIPISPTNLEAPFKEGAAGKLTSEFAGAGDNFFKQAVQPLPVLSQVGGALTAMGMSPLAANGETYRLYNAAFSERLAGMSWLKGHELAKESPEATGDGVLKTLADWTHKLNAGEIKRGGVMGTNLRPPIMDLRQLTYKDTAAALKISETDAKAVNKQLRNAMLDVPLAVRGLGDRMVDVVNNSPLFRSYLRAQGAGRFSWNPIFQGKLMAKTESLSQAMAGGKDLVMVENMFGKGPAIEDTRGVLRGAGIFDTAPAKAFKDARGGSEAVTDGMAVGANLSHALLPVQEKSIAGLVNKLATKAGVTPAEYVHNFPQETRDLVNMIAQYDRNSSLLHSPLMRTLNLAFFPLRFETKVATIMTKALAQTDTLTQVAVINGIMNAHDYLNSPEGMAWYSQNANVLKFMNYFTPTTTLSTVGQMLTGLSHEDWKTTAGAWELGGLPFGFIPMIINDEGANFSPGYIDPNSGQVISHQIPNSSKAQLQTALQDFIGSLFTYPGSELGLPSKSGVDKFLAGGLIGGQVPKTDFTPTQPYLSAQQQRYAQTIGGGTQAGTAPPGPTTPATSTDVPALKDGTAAPVYKNGAPKTPKLKKGQFKAQLPA